MLQPKQPDLHYSYCSFEDHPHTGTGLNFRTKVELWSDKNQQRRWMTGRHRERDGERWRHTSHISKATIQLSLTTLGASVLLIHSFKCGSTSGVAIPPSASAASCRTISCSEPSCNTRSKAGTEWGERSWPKTKAISCLENMWYLEL